MENMKQLFKSTGDSVSTWFWKMAGSIGGCKGRMQICLNRDTCCFLRSYRGSGTSGWQWKIHQAVWETHMLLEQFGSWVR